MVERARPTTVLRSVRELEKFRLLAKGGGGRACGRIKDVYFDDQSWVVSHLVVSVEPRRFGRKQVLLSPGRIGEWDNSSGEVRLALSVDELEAAPPASSVLPVCRQYATLAFTSPGAARFAGPALQAKPHLRSARAVTHYEVSAAGASGGRLVDFIVDSRQWQIRYLAIEETVEQKKLRFHVLPQDVERFSWAQQRVLLRELQPVVLELESMVPAFIAAA